MNAPDADPDAAKVSPARGYPVELDLRGEPVLVVGLGSVGRRKATGLIAAGAIVIGVDPRSREELQLAEGIEHCAEVFRPTHLESVRLAFAAATPAVNRQIVAEAKARGIWVNAASDPENGDLTVPAVWRGGGITLAVSTSGSSPALARMLRDRAAEVIAPAEPLVELLAALRPRVLERVADAETRRSLLIRWAEPSWLDVLATNGVEAVRLGWLDLLGHVERGGTLGDELPELS